MAHDVFISHSKRDKPTADAVCAALERHRIRCWIAPRDVMPGMEWGEAIVTAIHDSQVMVMVFSSQANESPHIRREVERAVAQGITIIPFRIEDIVPCDPLAFFIGNVHWLDALSPPLEKHLNELAGKVSVLLKRRQNSADGDSAQPPPVSDGKFETTNPPREITEVSRFCTQCGVPNLTEAKFCIECGASLVFIIKICGQCGARNSAVMRFCTNCNSLF